MKLWFKSPSESWTDCTPLGNGRMGLMADGGIFRERLYVNDGTLWTGLPYDDINAYKPTRVQSSLRKTRELILKGKRSAAERHIKKITPASDGHAFVPLGSFFIDYKIDARRSVIDHYVRELDLERAVFSSKFFLNDNQIEKSCFVSYPDNLCVFHVRSSRKLSFLISFTSPLSYETEVRDNMLLAHGNAPIESERAFALTPPSVLDTRPPGMAFAMAAKVITNGKLSNDSGALLIEQATDTLLVFRTKTGYNGYNKPPEIDPLPILNQLKSALSRQFDVEYLLRRHEGDYSELYKRVCLKLQPSNAQATKFLSADVPTDELLSRSLRGEILPSTLVELFYHLGRYLLISSSREGGEPSNLQGIWNRDARPPWFSAYNLKINTQMNYWAAGSCNLNECIEPLRRFAADLAKNGQQVASKLLGADGSAAFTSSDIWRKATPLFDDYSEYFPLCGAWLANQIYSLFTYSSDYSYAQDSELAAATLALLEENCRFVNTWLFEYLGSAVTCPSTSPENKIKAPLGGSHGMDFSTTVDISIIWELIENYKELCQKLKLEPTELLGDLLDKQARLYPLKIAADGTLLEWAEENASKYDDNPYFSPLYCLYPGNMLVKKYADDQKFLSAAKALLDKKVSKGATSTGWSTVWAMCLYARLKSGENAFDMLKKVIEQFTFTNLLHKHPPDIFQIDGNLGAVEGINQMLVQSGKGDIVELLPALPDAFANGYIYGLVIKGGYQIDMQWRNKKITTLDVKPPKNVTNPQIILVKNTNLSEDLCLSGCVEIATDN